MDEYIPSDDFVERTMKKIHDVSAKTEYRFLTVKFKLNCFVLKFGYVALAIMFGLINLVRLYFGVFAPINCR
jgi:hypothetical protein